MEPNSLPRQMPFDKRYLISLGERVKKLEERADRFEKENAKLRDSLANIGEET